MLNELLVVERGAPPKDIEKFLRHPDVKDAGGKSTLLVQLDEKGHMACIRPVSPEVSPWTLRDGQHNSFPFVQPSFPLWTCTVGEEWREMVLSTKKNDRREVLLSFVEKAQYDSDAFNDWPGKILLRRLQERNKKLRSLENTNAAIVYATIDRFLRACNQSPQQLIEGVTKALVENLRQTAQDDWIKIAVDLLVGKKFKNKWMCDGAFLFEAEGFSLSITDQSLIAPVSEALQIYSDDETQNQKWGICGLTGLESQLLSGNFHQPKLPAGLGQTYLFAKNKEIPANDRYGRFSVAAMPVGIETEKRMDAALRALTMKDREGKTWRALPGEAPKQSDLLLAFVEKALDAPMTAVVAENDAEEDFSEETANSVAGTANSIAVFENRTERLIEALRAKVVADFHKTPVRLIVIRKVDRANRKVVFAGAPTVADIHHAAKTWVAGERNVPPWLKLPFWRKGESTPYWMLPPHIAPLGLVAFSKQIFLHSGKRPNGKKKEQVGLPADRALGFFIDPVGNGYNSAWRQVERILQIVLSRRASLLAGVAHVLHKPESWGRRDTVMKEFDMREALQTVTLLGVILHKFSRNKEVYMNETAFRLGQLLAAADVVHAGYCADVRGGAVPPSLLGNQVFTMAQGAPAKALAVLCRRWKPYAGWAKKAARDLNRVKVLIESKQKGDQQKGWDIKKALRYAREMEPLAAELAPALKCCSVDDTFLAELLLGYIAGLPKIQKEDEDDQVSNHNENKGG